MTYFPGISRAWWQDESVFANGFLSGDWEESERIEVVQVCCKDERVDDILALLRQTFPGLPEPKNTY